MNRMISATVHGAATASGESDDLPSGTEVTDDDFELTSEQAAELIARCERVDRGAVLIPVAEVFRDLEARRPSRPRR